MLSPQINFEQVAELGRQADGGPVGRAYRSKRRSLYLPVIRSGLYDLFQIFDFADPSVVTGSRDNTTVAPQALYLMNSDLVRTSAQHLADRLLSQASGGREPPVDAACDNESLVQEAYERLYGRLPSHAEVARALDFLERYTKELPDSDGSKEMHHEAWQAWCRVLLASNEFLYVE
jgi:hypothetical protein